MYANVWQAIRHVFFTGYRQQSGSKALRSLLGLREFFRGLAPELLKVAPHNAIMFSTQNQLISRHVSQKLDFSKPSKSTGSGSERSCCTPTEPKGHQKEGKGAVKGSLRGKKKRYLWRVENKQTTYAKQLSQYEQEIMIRRLSELSEEEIDALCAEAVGARKLLSKRTL